MKKKKRETLRLLVCGQSGSGKTQNLNMVLEQFPIKYHKIFVFSNTADFQEDVYNKLKKSLVNTKGSNDVYIMNEVPEPEKLLEDEKNHELYKNEHYLFIFDDLRRNELKNMDILFRCSRPLGISVCLLNQSYFSVPRDVRENCSSLCIFHLDENLWPLYMAKQGYYGNKKIFDEYITKLRDRDNRFSFILMNSPIHNMKPLQFVKNNNIEE